MQFKIKCFCKKTEQTFLYKPPFNRNIVDELYCPECVDRAMLGTLLIRIYKRIPKIGLWGIKFNPESIKEVDKKFKESEEYYKNLFESGKCIFKGIKNKKDYELIWLKAGVHWQGEEALSGPDKIMVRKGGKPTKLPKKTRSGPEESYPPMHGLHGR